MNRIDIAKMAVSAVVGAGTTKIVGSIIKNNITPEKVIDHVTVISASFVLGAMAADASKVYTDAKIDAIATWWAEEIKPKFNS